MAPQLRVSTSESAFCKEMLLGILQLIAAGTGTHSGIQELERVVCPCTIFPAASPSKLGQSGGIHGRMVGGLFKHSKERSFMMTVTFLVLVLFLLQVRV